jgi:hypothetical protein
MTLIQNQSSVGLPNILHDEGLPNTLARMTAPAQVAGLRLPVVVFVALVLAIMVGLTTAVLLAGLAT